MSSHAVRHTLKRLFFIAPSAYPLGGIANWIDYLVPGLREYGWDVVLGLVSGHFHDIAKYISAHPSINVICIENNTGSREGRIRAIQRALRSACPDLALSVNIPDLYSAVNREKYRGSRLHSVASLHGLQSDYFNDLRRFGRLIDGVICTNRLATALSESEGGIARSRVCYAPYGVVVQGHKKEENLSKSFDILFVGRLEEEQKRCRDLVDILEYFHASEPDCHLTIVGAGPAQSSLQQAFGNRGLLDRVSFKGAVPAHEVASFYGKADVILVTSRWETGPLVIWEAMARGLPVVTSRYIGSGLEGSLNHGENCLMFDVGDVKAAASCLEKLRRFDSLAARLAERGRKLVQARYSQEISLQEWHLCLKKLAETEPRPAVEESRPPPSGRLERLLGPGCGESIRSLLGMRYQHASPGGEWPHSYGAPPAETERFLELAVDLDRASHGGHARLAQGQ